jgi:glycosyltransferase involved in cell wall biosynthesis
LVRAIASALNQSAAPAEVIVCVDGDPAVDLGPFEDHPSVKVVHAGVGVGGNAARQAGIFAARSAIVALLDDDDVWHAEKLRAQLDLAATARGDRYWFATCMLRPLTPTGAALDIVPRIKIEAGEDLPSYLFRKKTLRAPQGFIQSSTLMFPRSLAIDVPFDASLPFHQDIGWLMDVYSRFPEVEVLQVARPLVDFHLSRDSMISRITPDGSIRWARDRLSRHGRRLVADFILTQTLEVVTRRPNAIKEQLRVTCAAFRYGAPGLAVTARALLIVCRSMLWRLRGERGDRT